MSVSRAESSPPVSDSAVATSLAADGERLQDAPRHAVLARLHPHVGDTSGMALPIEDYALIGDRGTAALVGKDGSIDWLCLPRFDSPACFAALLGTEDNGRWLLAPADEVVATSRRYVDGTALLETTFTTAEGELVLLDVMPTGDDRADVVRRLTCTRGTVRVRHDWVVRTDYGKVRPWVTRDTAHGNEVVVAIAGPDKFVLRGPRLPRGHEGHHSDEFDMGEGDEATFSMTWVRSWRDVPEPKGFDERIEATTEQQRAWSERSPSDVPHADMVQRSLVTLMLMTHAETGGIVAAPTTSLPEDFGGERNWDYRFCWLRDAALTLESLLGAGYAEEAHAVAALVAAGGRRRPGRPADHVHHRRRTSAARARAARTCPATPTAVPCGSATARSRSGRTTCWAR